MLAFAIALPARAIRQRSDGALRSARRGSAARGARWVSTSAPRPRGAWDLDAADSAGVQDGRDRGRGHGYGRERGTEGGRGSASEGARGRAAGDSRQAPQRRAAWREEAAPRRGAGDGQQQRPRGGDEWREQKGWAGEEWGQAQPRRGWRPDSRSHGEDRGYAREGRDGPPSELQLALASESHDLLYGISPVLAALRTGRRLCKTLFLQEDRGTYSGAAASVAAAAKPDAQGGSSSGPSRKSGHEASMREILRLAAALGVAIRKVNKGDLNVLSSNRPHQGFVLQATRIEYEDITTLGPAPKMGLGGSAADESTAVAADDKHREGLELAPVWLVLDEVTDPQNFGALVRSAHFLGAEGVIACKRNSSALTAAVSKASSGALEVSRVRGVASMPRFLRTAAADGWRVVGAALAPAAIRTRDLPRGPPTLLVLGSEGRGLRPMVQESCDVLLRIDGRNERAIDDPVDSLNVSVAGAIALHHLVAR